MTLEILQADYANPEHAQDIVSLLNHYALDPMGGEADLSAYTKDNLISELAKRPYAFSVLAYQDSDPVGLGNCFESFSTFKARPLINIHDMIVVPKARGQGVSQQILNKVEEIAIQRGACKITLEVLSKNQIAQNSYKKFGFKSYELDPEAGHALFWEKAL